MRHDLPEARRASVLAALLALCLGASAVSPAPTFAAPAAAASKRKDAAPAEKPASRHGSVRYYLRHAGAAQVLAVADYDWRIEGKRYELRNVVETVGVLAALKPTRTAQASQGEITAEGLRPVSFVHERKKGKVDNAQFDWKTARLSYRDENVALPPGTQDLLSLYAQLAWLAPREGALDIPVATGAKLATYRLSAGGEERLPGGKTALRVSALNDDQRIEFWLPVPAAGKRAFPAEMPLPLRVRVTEKNGMAIEQSLDAPPQ